MPSTTRLLSALGLLLLQCHWVLAFVPTPTVNVRAASSTELNLLRKDGRVRTGFRKARGFVRRRIFRRKLDKDGFDTSLVVEMRNETEAVVENMVPLVAAQSIEEDIEIIEQPEDFPMLEEVVEQVQKPEDHVTGKEVSLTEPEGDVTAEAVKGVALEEANKTEAEALDQMDALANDGISYTERTVQGLLEARLAANQKKKPEEKDATATEAEALSEVRPSQVDATEPAVEPEVSGEAQTIGKVDLLFEQGKPQEALDLLGTTDIQANGDLYWRAIKAHYEMFSSTEDEKQQQAYLEKGLDLVHSAPAYFDKYANTKAFLLKWKAILLGKLGGFQSTKEKMANSFVIRESLEEARQLFASLGAEDGSIYQALGEWCFKVAGISFIERQAASVLFGKPPQSSYEEALEHFLKGYELKPTPALALKVADTYQKLGKKQLATEWSKKAVPKEEMLLP